LTKLAKLAGLIVIVGVLAAGLLLPYVGGAGLAAKAGADKFLDTKCTLKPLAPQQTSTMYASDGKTVIATFFDQNRSIIPLSRVSKNVINALISTEDRRFYDHHGVDTRGLLRAALHTSSGNKQGASTLTEQYVKQIRYYQATTPEEQEAAIVQTLDRKISDAQCALKMERDNTKKQILEGYLNIAFFGENSYGIQRAAQTFFNTSADKLTVAQAALLVGLVKSPTSLDPFAGDKQLQAARTRRDLVISNMADQHFITDAAATRAKATPVKLAPAAVPPRGCAFATKAITNVGFFCDYAYRWLQQVGGLTQQKIDTGGYQIVTTIDPGQQNQVQASLSADMAQSLAFKKPNGDAPSAAIMPGIDPSTGAVKFLATSRQYGSGAPNKTTNPIFSIATAGAGSTFKYFTALAALKLGAQDSFQLTTGGTYHTKNCPPGTDPQPNGYHNAGNYAQTMTLRNALVQSSNTYFVGMEDMVFNCDLHTIIQTAKDVGNSSLNILQSDGKTLGDRIIAGQEATFTLGQHSVSPIDLTVAYGTAANDGVLCPPNPIASITEPGNTAVKINKPACSRKLDPYTARTVVDIMVGDTNNGAGTAVGAFNNWYGNGGSRVAGKTGTNNGSDGAGNDSGNNAALWFVGATPHLVSTTAIYNPDAPTHDIIDAPGHLGGSGNAFGAVSAGLWAHALLPSVGAQHWDWPGPQDIPNGVFVPSVKGKSPDEAMNTLTQLGFKPVILPNQVCGSQYPEGTVAMAGPAFAALGSTISICLSNGKAPFVFVAPTKAPKPTPGSPIPGGPNPRPTKTKPGR
jgi:membrane peptidoglycan carboxypeptidase